MNNNNCNNSIYDIKETAKKLHISISMLRKLIYEKDIRFFKIGNRYYFREEDLKNFIEKRIGGYLYEN